MHIHMRTHVPRKDPSHDNAKPAALAFLPSLRLLVLHLLLGTMLLAVLHLLLVVMLRAREAACSSRIGVLGLIAHGISSLVMRPAILLMLRLVLLLVVEGRHMSASARLQIDVNPPFIVLGVVLQT